MNQHPIPQNVTTYQFRLIGDMTIQQFIYLAIGIAAAIFFYYTNLFTPIKWFFVIMCSAAGFGVAFMPIDDRPLDKWITNFLKAIYSETQYVWRRSIDVPDYLTFTSTRSLTPTDAPEVYSQALARRQQGLRSFLVTLPSDQVVSDVDQMEEMNVGNLMMLFNGMGNNAAYDVSTTAPVTDDYWETQTEPEDKLEAGRQKPEEVVEETSLIPSTPVEANVVIGLVAGSDGVVIPSAMIEITDDTDIPVRATKTNDLGQFFSTTPLKRGTYKLRVEKDGYKFDTIKLALTDQVVEPVVIYAKAQ